MVVGSQRLEQAVLSWKLGKKMSREAQGNERHHAYKGK